MSQKKAAPGLIQWLHISVNTLIRLRDYAVGA